MAGPESRLPAVPEHGQLLLAHRLVVEPVLNYRVFAARRRHLEFPAELTQWYDGLE